MALCVQLPVLSLDVASDSTLLATGSADKSIKLWGLDFGDCHRSLLAHGDAVTAVRFVPGTHYLFSASKDKAVKYWDGDKVRAGSGGGIGGAGVCLCVCVPACLPITRALCAGLTCVLCLCRFSLKTL
jgi:WD40 repeat protein